MWKAVVGFEGYYEVSDDGVVRSVDRVYEGVDSMGRHYRKKMPGRVLATRLHRFGYPVVTLSKDNVAYTRTVHKLVAETFLGKRSDGIVVRHLDGNPANNSVINLKYGTQKDNMMDAISHDTVEMGERRYNAKLTSAIVVEIRERKAAGARNTDLAQEYELSDEYIHHIVTGAKWASAGGPISAKRQSNILDANDRIRVVEMRRNGASLKKIADNFGVSVQQVVNITKEAA